MSLPSPIGRGWREAPGEGERCRTQILGVRDARGPAISEPESRLFNRSRRHLRAAWVDPAVSWGGSESTFDDLWRE